MKKFILVLAAFAAMSVASAEEVKVVVKNAEAFIEKMESVNLDDKVEKVYASTNAYDQFEAVCDRVKDLQVVLTEVFVYASSGCAGSEYEDRGAECLAMAMQNLENLKKELTVLDTDLRMVVVKLRAMGVLDD